MVRICSNYNVSMGIDASLSFEKYCVSLVFHICVFESVGFTEKNRCEKLPTDSGRKRRQVGDGSRFETTPCSRPSTAHGDVGLFYRSVRSCKISFRACLSSAELQT